MSFSTLGLSEPILRAIQLSGYTTPTPIQLQAIPVILKGHDILASAQTGTGKTAGFVLPLLERLSKRPRARANQASILILAPTRELAAQIHASILEYGQFLKLNFAVVFGGVKINPQMISLRKGVDILIATPGRLLDLYNQNAVRFEQLDTLVLDEADRMLDMGFIHDIKKVMALLPKSRQTLLFSATFSTEIGKLAKAFLKNPVEISVTPRNRAAISVKQDVHPVDKSRKAELLSHLIREQQWHQALVFTRTKHGANKLVKQLATDGIPSVAIHGNKSQAQRTKALANFKDGDIQILVATDIAARGIDIDQLPIVVNFDLPQVPEDYVHRIGRTGRAGSEGHALSLVCADEARQLHAIEQLIKTQLERIEIDDFEPTHQIPQNISQAPVRHNPRAAQSRSSGKPSTTNANRHKSSSSTPQRRGEGRSATDRNRSSARGRS